MMGSLQSEKKQLDLQQKLDDQSVQHVVNLEDCYKRCESMQPNGKLLQICKAGCYVAHQSHSNPIKDMQDTFESIGRSFFHLSDIISMGID